MRIQSILKFRDLPYDCDDNYSYGCGRNSGLYHSAEQIIHMLSTMGHTTKLSYATDNNDIDRSVSKFRPNVCIIEGFWVIPEKFTALTHLHPNIIWVIRNHSAVPFAAQEGIIMDWSMKYVTYPKVFLSCNDLRTAREFQRLIEIAYDSRMRTRVPYLPNYQAPPFFPRKFISGDIVNIGCFGAIRALKNHLQQAVVALAYADSIEKPLHFHINGTRIEGGANPIRNNLRGLFAHMAPHQLIEHPWLKRAHFIQLIRTMDAIMQVSDSETFSYVAADAVTNDVPVIGSAEIPWLSSLSVASPNNPKQIREMLAQAIKTPALKQLNLGGIRAFSKRSMLIWQKFLTQVPFMV